MSQSSGQLSSSSDNDTPPSSAPPAASAADPEKKAIKEAHKKEREEQKKQKHEQFLKKQEEKEKKKREDEARKKEKEQKQSQQGAEDAALADGKKKPEKKKKEKEDKDAAEPFVNQTRKGEKKDTSLPLAEEYHPPAVEAAWYEWWEAKGLFSPTQESTAEKFVMVIPPPNVTGALHVGHALTNSIQDALVRWHRMRGERVLWVPGVDHAGIATQMVVEKQLARRGVSRQQLGREAFVAEVWKWKEQYGTRICSQLRRLGGALDWSRECFTMDARLSRAVLEAFVRLHRQGLIYRDCRLVNWVCHLNTAIADIEMEPLELAGPTPVKVPGYDREIEFGVLTLFAYPVEGGGELVVGTTRVETMLADTAVAVHPDDARYKHLHGKQVRHPFHDTLLPIICDAELVQMDFGTGALKVTPAHDPNDYECGKRHGLRQVNLLTDDGRLTAAGGPFAGQLRYAARTAVTAALQARGLLRGTRPNPMTVHRCARSGDIIEPLLKPQWYVRCADLGRRAMQAVADGQLRISPPSFVAVWNRWLENVRDWCISRQLWWGHRVPAFLVEVRGQAGDPERTESWEVAHSEAEARAAAAVRLGVRPDELRLVQDKDVLDTWFSSALFPFSVFGWPDDTADLRAFYPTSLLETGSDILFFWVARMVMMGLTLTGQLPFRQILLHSIVRDAFGEKMSKSKGNVVDPIDVIEGISLDQLVSRLQQGNLPAKEVIVASEGMRRNFPHGIPECGTDALRFGLAMFASQDAAINLDPNKIGAYRNFCNKIWNAVRFVLAKLGGPAEEQGAAGALGPVDRWALSRLARTVDAAHTAFVSLRLGLATDAIHRFWWEDFCDVYLEAVKQVFVRPDTPPERVAAVRTTLYRCVDEGLRLLHPFMPFVSEELWQHLPRPGGGGVAPESILQTPYPSDTSARNEPLEAEVERVITVVRAARSLKTAYRLVKSQRPPVFVRCATLELKAQLEVYAAEMAALSFAAVVHVTLRQPLPPNHAVSVVDSSLELHMDLSGLVDLEAEAARLEKVLAKTRAELQTVQKRIAAPGFSNAPKEVREKTHQTAADLQTEIANIESAIQNFHALKGQK